MVGFFPERANSIPRNLGPLGEDMRTCKIFEVLQKLTKNKILFPQTPVDLNSSIHFSKF